MTFSAYRIFSFNSHCMLQCLKWSAHHFVEDTIKTAVEDFLELSDAQFFSCMHVHWYLIKNIPLQIVVIYHKH